VRQTAHFRAGKDRAVIIGSWMLGSFGRLVHTSRLRTHLLRGLLAAVSWWCYYMSFKTLSPALATTLTFSAQLFVLMLLWPVLRERVTRPQLASTLVGFAGVLVAARVFSPTALDWAVLCGRPARSWAP